ncbi:hypothetical protein BC938DRAFT_478653 [Jimgerdemannia flammicorona]|uniref:Uncharacterized protein n=1 Tax=Jimgerdemannia flammicorona TaxID=994334 RepID=A0A433QMK2_9FUNG|nr:hypothetical protein BC938DRAFT_478653 [Jimgerdemannia flammicorona]
MRASSWMRRALVFGTFLSSIVTGKYHPYLTATLVVELSNIFLHQQRDAFYASWHWGMALFGMFAMNVLNLQLFGQIGSSDGWFEGVGWLTGKLSRRQRKSARKTE